MSTSSQALQEITADGSRQERAEIAFTLVSRYPGFTANELETTFGYRDGQIRKRLKELECEGRIKRGRSRPSAVTGKNNTTWYPVV